MPGLQPAFGCWKHDSCSVEEMVVDDSADIFGNAEQRYYL